MSEYWAQGQNSAVPYRQAPNPTSARAPAASAQQAPYDYKQYFEQRPAQVEQSSQRFSNASAPPYTPGQWQQPNDGRSVNAVARHGEESQRFQNDARQQQSSLQYSSDQRLQDTAGRDPRAGGQLQLGQQPTPSQPLIQQSHQQQQQQHIQPQPGGQIPRNQWSSMPSEPQSSQQSYGTQAQLQAPAPRYSAERAGGLQPAANALRTVAEPYSRPQQASALAGGAHVTPNAARSGEPYTRPRQVPGRSTTGGDVNAARDFGQHGFAGASTTNIASGVTGLDSVMQPKPPPHVQLGAVHPPQPGISGPPSGRPAPPQDFSRGRGLLSTPASGPSPRFQLSGPGRGAPVGRDAGRGLNMGASARAPPGVPLAARGGPQTSGLHQGGQNDFGHGPVPAADATRASAWPGRDRMPMMPRNADGPARRDNWQRSPFRPSTDRRRPLVSRELPVRDRDRRETAGDTSDRPRLPYKTLSRGHNLPQRHITVSDALLRFPRMHLASEFLSLVPVWAQHPERVLEAAGVTSSDMDALKIDAGKADSGKTGQPGLLKEALEDERTTITKKAAGRKRKPVGVTAQLELVNRLTERLLKTSPEVTEGASSGAEGTAGVWEPCHGPLTTPARIDIREVVVSSPVPEDSHRSTETPPSTKYNVRVMLLSGSHPADIAREQSQKSPNDPDPYAMHIKCVVQRVLKKGHSTLALLGGTFDRELDGGAQLAVDAPPQDEHLIHTAVRCIGTSYGLDLSSVKTWTRVGEVHYMRPPTLEDPEQEEISILMIPHIHEIMPSRDQYIQEWLRYEVDKEKALTSPKESGQKVVGSEKGDTMAVDKDVNETKTEDKKSGKAVAETAEDQRKRLLERAPSDPALVVKVRRTEEDRPSARCIQISLDGLLDYDQDDIMEKTMEASMFAEMLSDMLQMEAASQILILLRAWHQVQEEKDKVPKSGEGGETEGAGAGGKRKANEALALADESEAGAAKRQKAEGAPSDDQSTGKNEEGKAEESTDWAKVALFRVFDKNALDYVRVDDLEGALLALAPAVSVTRAEARQLVRPLVSDKISRSRAYYRDLCH